MLNETQVLHYLLHLAVLLRLSGTTALDRVMILIFFSNWSSFANAVELLLYRLGLELNVSQIFVCTLCQRLKA